MTRHYKKEIESSPVFILGAPFRFDILETSDPTLITELDKCVARHIGGVIAITPEEYAEENKKKLLLSSSDNSKPHHRQEISALHLDPTRVVEAVANPAPRGGMFAKPQIPTDQMANGHITQSPPEPIEVPTPESFVIKQPPTAKLSQSKQVQK